MPEALLMRDLFDKVAWRYDLANRVMSAGSDRRWRRAVADEVLRENPKRVLDCCSGTGDQAIVISQDKRFEGRVLSLDISLAMMRQGRAKMRQRGLADWPLMCDVHSMGLKEAQFDCATICFGVRNFQDICVGLREIGRVLRPAGRIIILEFSRPTQPWLWRLYRWYLTGIVPRIGGFLTRQRDAYRYLATSIEGFMTPGELARCLEEAGFTGVRHRYVSAGIVAITTAQKG